MRMKTRMCVEHRVLEANTAPTGCLSGGSCCSSALCGSGFQPWWVMWCSLPGEAVPVVLEWPSMSTCSLVAKTVQAQGVRGD